MEWVSRGVSVGVGMDAGVSVEAGGGCRVCTGCGAALLVLCGTASGRCSASSTLLNSRKGAGYVGKMVSKI